jgi:hypothetical protein
VRRIVLALVAALLTASGAFAATTLRPAKLVVTAKQVGPGFVRVPFTGGTTLKRPTLDMCHLTFRSEALRTARNQVTFQRGQFDPTIANEVVAYKPGGAALAMRDARASVTRCPKGAVHAGNTIITTKITVLHLSGDFLPGSLALELHVAGTVGGRHVSLDGAALYQRRGDVLSGVYAYASTPDLRIRFMVHAAEQSARILRVKT